MTATATPHHQAPRLLESPPLAVESLFGSAGAGEPHRLICVHADMASDGLHYGEQWVAVTSGSFLVTTHTTQGWELTQTQIDTVLRAHTEVLVGGGRLLIERQDEPTILVAFTSTEAAKFSEVARGVEQLRKQQPFLINGILERIRCQTCGRLLPERDGVCPACIHKWSTMKRITGYISPYRWKAVVLAVASVVTTMAELAPPLITKRIIDDVLVVTDDNPAPLDERIELLGFLVSTLIAFRVVSWGAEWVHGWIVAWLGAQATADIRSQLYRSLEMLSLQFYDKRKVGALMSRVTRDTGRLQDFLVDGLPYLLINGMMIVGILGFLLYMNWQLTIYTLIPVPFILVWSVVFWKRMRRFFTRWGEVWSNLTDRVAEALSGIRVVKAFAQQEREIGTFGALNRKITDIGVETSVNRTIFFATISFLTGFGVIIVWYFGGQEVLSKQLSLGTLMAFYSYMWMVYGPLEWFGQVNSWMSRAFAGAERVFEVIDTTPESY
ncbi:MAG: hypothetical protein HN712_18910, partial [Gemmatimonadetes bacterium]|nr:hypothetical protein [Gemmatimonadota bacterium]